jgi:hypothetical protein
MLWVMKLIKGGTMVSEVFNLIKRLFAIFAPKTENKVDDAINDIINNIDVKTNDLSKEEQKEFAERLNHLYAEWNEHEGISVGVKVYF